jgi:hypothetical protein
MCREAARVNLKSKTSAAAELMYEVDSLYVSTEIILSGRFGEFPLDGLLQEACLLHFRIVWDFFYKPAVKTTDITVRSFVPQWKGPAQPARLKAIREWLNVMLAHLTTRRTEPGYKAGEITATDIQSIREHTKALFGVFVTQFSDDQRKELINPLAHKFTQYETLNP